MPLAIPLVAWWVSVLITVALNIIAIALNRRNVEQGKLNSVDVDIASYGVAIPIFFGSQLGVMQTTYIEDNKLIEETRKTLIFFGIGGSITTYYYFVTMYGIIGESVVRPGKIWLADQFAADYRAESISNFERFGEAARPLGNAGERITLASEIEADYIHYYTGEEGQLPPQDMVEKLGIDGVTGLRGRSGFYIKRLALADFGNTPPTWKVEAIANSNQFLAERLQFSPSVSFNLSRDNEGTFWSVSSGNRIRGWVPHLNAIEFDKVLTGYQIQLDATIPTFDCPWVLSVNINEDIYGKTRRIVAAGGNSAWFFTVPSGVAIGRISLAFTPEKLIGNNESNSVTAWDESVVTAFLNTISISTSYLENDFVFEHANLEAIDGFTAISAGWEITYASFSSNARTYVIAVRTDTFQSYLGIISGSEDVVPPILIDATGSVLTSGRWYGFFYEPTQRMYAGKAGELIKEYDVNGQYIGEVGEWILSDN